MHEKIMFYDVNITCYQRTKFRFQVVNSFFFLIEIFISSIPWKKELSLENDQDKRFKDYAIDVTTYAVVENTQSLVKKIYNSKLTMI